MAGTKIVIQGFGNVGGAAATLLHKAIFAADFFNAQAKSPEVENSELGLLVCEE